MGWNGESGSLVRNGAKRQFARELRRNMTDAERVLWRALRAKQIEGHRFRRQVPIGPYVVDFACLRQKLIVEVDGGQHLESAADAVRTRRLSKHGWRVLRFWNHDVLQRTEQVLEAIIDALMASEARHLPPP